MSSSKGDQPNAARSREACGPKNQLQVHWVAKSGVLSRVAILTTLLSVLITLLLTTLEHPSTLDMPFCLRTQNAVPQKPTTTPWKPRARLALPNVNARFRGLRASYFHAYAPSPCPWTAVAKDKRRCLEQTEILSLQDDTCPPERLLPIECILIVLL